MEQLPGIYLYRRIVQAKLYIDKNYSRPISLKILLDEACFSKFHFIRLFKKIYGITPHQYLIRIRVERAKELLKGEKPVSLVCGEVGFQSLSSFTSLFKKMCGISPGEFSAREYERARSVSRSPLNFIPGCFAEKNGWKSINSNFR